MATQKKYICAFCARAFTRSEHKQRHERSHTNEKPFHCLRCTSSFVRRDLLQRHCRTVHNIHLVAKDDDDQVEKAASALASAAQVTKPKSRRSSGRPSSPQGVSASASAPSSPHDLIHLLSITRKLEAAVDDSDYDGTPSINDAFLIGYTHLVHTANSAYPVVEKMMTDVVNYLHQLNHNKESPTPAKTGIIYSVCALGYALNRQWQRGMTLFSRSWRILVEELVPNYNRNSYLLDQIDILNQLFLLALVYLDYMAGTDTPSPVSAEVVLNYLDEISAIILGNLGDDPTLIDLHLELFWAIYSLLSSCLVGDVPKCYRFFLDKPVVRATAMEQVPTLADLMATSSRSCITAPSSVTNSGTDDYWRSIIILTLRNELKLFTAGEEHAIFSSKNFLHNSIILSNKSFSVGWESAAAVAQMAAAAASAVASAQSVSPRSSVVLNENGPASAATTNASATRLFALFKKNCIINAPSKFHELLNNYLVVPNKVYHWELFAVTLGEINLYSPINRHLEAALGSVTTDADGVRSRLHQQLHSFLTNKQQVVDINNNLSIISFPIIFLTNFVNLGLMSVSSFHRHQLDRMRLVIFEWYVVMLKILLFMWQEPSVFDENYIVQSLVFLLLDNKKPLLARLDGNTEEFTFTHKWFSVLKLKFDAIFDTWLDFASASAPSAATNQLKSVVHSLMDSLVAAEAAKVDNSPKAATPLGFQMPPPAPPPLSYNERRANSITLGMLQQSTMMLPATESPHTNGTNYNSFIRQGSISSSSSRQGSSSSSSRLGSVSYSTYAPLSTVIPGRELVLPPILPKTETEEKLQPLLHTVGRKQSS